MLASFDTNDRINHLLLDNLALKVWRTKPPGGKGRNIADIAWHIHNVRYMWIKAVAFRTCPAS